MARTTFVACVAFAFVWAAALTSTSRGQPREVQNQQPPKAKEIYTILQVTLYEVDDAYYKKYAKSRWISKEEHQRMEDEFLGIAPNKALPAAESWFDLLGKQILLVKGKEVGIDPGQEGVLLDLNKTINRLPSPDQLRKGQRGPQTIQEGISLCAQAEIKADRRYVRVKFTEKSEELEGVEKVSVDVGKNGKPVDGELVFLKEAVQSLVRDIPDGASILLPLQYRPRGVRDNERWLVVVVTPQIFFEAEARLEGGAGKK